VLNLCPGSAGGFSKSPQESAPTFVEDSSLQESLRSIIAGLTANAVLQEDLMQEGLVHLWKVARDNPGQTKSWYLQSFRFHVRHWLAAGRSLDSPKRAQPGKRIALDENDSEVALPEYHTNGELFEAVSFRDVVSTLAKHLKPREQIVLCGLAEDLSVSEIASRFGISRPTVLKDQRKIAALTIKLGISQRLWPLKQDGVLQPKKRPHPRSGDLQQSWLVGFPTSAHESLHRSNQESRT